MASESLHTKTKVEQQRIYDRRDTALEMFIAQVRGTPLLTPEQEQNLGSKVQAGIAANGRLEEKKKYKGRIKDLELAQKGDVAKEHFINANLLLVVDIAYDYYFKHPKGKKYGLNDLIQEGTFGLIRAVEKFDPAKGFRFSSYATWWIRQSIQRALIQKANTLALPTNVEPRVVELTMLEEKGLDDDALQEELGVDKVGLAGLREARVVNSPTMRLDAPRNSEDTRDGASSWSEYIADPASRDPLTLVIEAETCATKGTDGITNETLAVLWPTLKRVLDPSYIVVLEKMIAGDRPASQVDILSETEERLVRKIRGLLYHPAIRAELVGAIEQADREMIEPDWRSEAACIGKIDIFTKKGYTTAEERQEIANTCAGCAVRSACRAYFFEEKPGLGRWENGITVSQLVNERKAKKRTRSQ